MGKKRLMKKDDALETIAAIMRHGSIEEAEIAKAEVAKAKADLEKMSIEDMEDGDLDTLRYEQLIDRLRGIGKQKTDPNKITRTEDVKKFIKAILDGEIDNKREVIIDESDL